MPIIIDGVKYYAKELEGTDIGMVRKFCAKNKIKAAFLIYCDDNDEIQTTGVWYTKKAKKVINDFINKL